MFRMYEFQKENAVVWAEPYMPKGFLDNGCLPLFNRISRCFNPQEGESMNIPTHAISLYRDKATRTCYVTVSAS